MNNPGHYCSRGLFLPTIFNHHPMEVSWLKRVLSYFFLVTIKEIPSKFNPGLCLQMEAGRLLLNSKNANYSYGNLQKAFEEVFETIEIEKRSLDKVLILGLGTGSVIDILQRQYGFDPEITGVEIDEAVIACLKYWDQLDLSKTTVLNQDAETAMDQLSDTFDLIIVDLFIDMEVHPIVFTEKFSQQLKSLLTPQGFVLLNFIANTKAQREKFAELQLMLMRFFKDIKGHDVMGMNKILELKTESIVVNI